MAAYKYRHINTHTETVIHDGRITHRHRDRQAGTQACIQRNIRAYINTYMHTYCQTYIQPYTHKYIPSGIHTIQAGTNTHQDSHTYTCIHATYINTYTQTTFKQS